MKPRLPHSVPAHLARLQPYQPGLPIETLARVSGLPAEHISKLASNENPYGPGPRARLAMRRAAASTRLYPDQHTLRLALAGHHNLTPDHIVLGNGSNDVLDLIARVFLSRAGDEAISSQHAFAIYAIATTTAGGHNIITPATPHFGHDLTAMHAAITPRTRVIWLANPNNPTGTFIPYPQVWSFLAAVPQRILVVLDEAYCDYLPPADRTDSPRWLAAHPNLILTRTFSKAHGLAGLRIGYSLSAPSVADLLNRVRQPFNVSSIGLAAATAALTDEAYLHLSYRRNQRGLRQLETGLDRLSLHYLSSAANFVTVRVPSSLQAYESLLRLGIITRPLAGYNLPEYLRVTVGRPSENTQFLEALPRILNL